MMILLDHLNLIYIYPKSKTLTMKANNTFIKCYQTSECARDTKKHHRYEWCMPLVPVFSSWQVAQIYSLTIGSRAWSRASKFFKHNNIYHHFLFDISVKILKFVTLVVAVRAVSNLKGYS